MAERRRLEVLPELGIRYGDEREIRLVIDPRNIPNPPPATAALLQTDQRSIENLVGRGENLLFANDRAGFLCFPRAFAPGLVVVVLLARNFYRHAGMFPRRQG